MPVATFRIKFLETGYLLSDLTIRLDRRGQDGMATFITGFYSFLKKFTDSAGLGEIMNFLMSLVANHSLKYYQTESPFPYLYVFLQKILFYPNSSQLPLFWLRCCKSKNHGLVAIHLLMVTVNYPLILLRSFNKMLTVSSLCSN